MKNCISVANTTEIVETRWREDACRDVDGALVTGLDSGMDGAECESIVYTHVPVIVIVFIKCCFCCVLVDLMYDRCLLWVLVYIYFW